MKHIAAGSERATGLPGIYPLAGGFIAMVNVGPLCLWIGMGRRGAVRLINWFLRDDVEYGLLEMMFD